MGIALSLNRHAREALRLTRRGGRHIRGLDHRTRRRATQDMKVAAPKDPLSGFSWRLNHFFSAHIGAVLVIHDPTSEGGSPP